jgi:AcrR family transcriptional regulator
MAYDRPMTAHQDAGRGRDAGLGGGCGAGSATRRLRADAERNRAAIVAAAQNVFAEHGLEAPLEEIAQRAGVGIATLYRRFPAREQLVAAALIDKVTQYADAAAQAAADSDPWTGFVGYVRRICELQAGDRGLSDLLSMTLAADERIEQLRAEANAQVVGLIERAKAAGKLRPDFVGEDLLLVLIASAAVGQATRADAPDSWRRFVALVLDAFERRDAPPLPPAPSTEQMVRAMRRLAAERGCGRGNVGPGAC